MKERQKTTEFFCAICERFYASRDSLREHNDFFHSIEGGQTRYASTSKNKPPLSCPHCPYCTRWESEMRKHVAAHVRFGSAMHGCRECGRQFSHYTAMRKHLRMVHLTHKCSCCRQRFATKEEMMAHKSTHSDVYACDICGVVYASRDSAGEHARRHSQRRVRKYAGAPSSMSITIPYQYEEASSSTASPFGSEDYSPMLLNDGSPIDRPPNHYSIDSPNFLSSELAMPTLLLTPMQENLVEKESDFDVSHDITEFIRL